MPAAYPRAQTREHRMDEPVRRRDIWRDYDIPLEVLRPAIERQVEQMGYDLVVTHRPDRVVFRTGLSWKSWAGQRMFVTLHPSNGRTRVVVRGQLQGFQLYDWGEPDSIARRLFRGLDTANGWQHKVLDQNLRNPFRVWLNLGLLAAWVALVTAFLWR